METLIIATRNAHKVAEIRTILSGTYRYLTLNDLPEAPALVEDADTFAGNAARKAQGLAQWLADVSRPEWRGPGLRRLILADDSGLEVDTLNGAPGVHSARFAAMNEVGGSNAGAGSGNSSDDANNAELLRLLHDVPADQRTARFRCVLAVVEMVPSGGFRGPHFFEGTCEGRIDFTARGRKGFGYDPLFVPAGYRHSFAELGEAIKNRLSHRAPALTRFRDWLCGGLTSVP